MKQGPFRWLTVRVPDHPGTEIFLDEPGPPVLVEAKSQPPPGHEPCALDGVADVLDRLGRKK